MKRLLCAFIIITVGVLCGNCFADDGWTVNTVIYGTNNYPTIAVDVQNTPIIVCENYPQNLKLIKQTPTGYDVNVIPQTENCRSPKLKITSNNELAVLFLSGSSTLKYGSKGDWFDWIFSQVQTGASLRSPAEMALTSNDIPHIAYEYSNYVRHIFFDVHSQQWAVESFITAYSPRYSSIAVDSSDKILICYHNGKSGIDCILNSDDNWTFLPTILSATYPDCDFNAEGMPAAAYIRANKIYYAVYIDGAGWIETQAAQLASSSVRPVVLAHSSTGIPGIAYIDNTKLMYATNIAGGWTTTEIDEYGSYPDLIFDKNDKPLVTYVSTDNRFGWNLPVLKLAGIGLASMNNAFDISGRITDSVTGLPIANASVYWNSDTFGKLASTTTDVNGFYQFDDMPPGVIDIQVTANYYADDRVLDITFSSDINNLDFALVPRAALSGKVLDNATGQPIPNVPLEYHIKYSEENSMTGFSISDANGNFSFLDLWHGAAAEVKAKPAVESGYAWNLPWGADFITLSAGEYRSERIIFLEKGTLVSGHIKDANGDPAGNFEFYCSGRSCDVSGSTDANGVYQIRLPKGTFNIQPSNDDVFGMLNKTFTITNVNNDVNLSDIIIYTSATGEQISGDINNPGEYAKTGSFAVWAYEAGTTLNDPNIWLCAIVPSSDLYLENAGAFSLTNLPADVNYDIYLAVFSETPDGRQVFTIRDSVFNTVLDTNNVYLEYNSAGNTVSGYIKNINDAPVLGATVLLFDSVNNFKGFCEANANGLYAIYNVPDGNYTITAIHSKYANASMVIDVNGTDVNAPEIVMPFDGGKEGPDLNGNGVIDLPDIAELSSQWLDAGINEADFNQDGSVNFFDWLPIADNWMWKAIWLNE